MQQVRWVQFVQSLSIWETSLNHFTQTQATMLSQELDPGELINVSQMSILLPVGLGYPDVCSYQTYFTVLLPPLFTLVLSSFHLISGHFPETDQLDLPVKLKVLRKSSWLHPDIDSAGLSPPLCEMKDLLPAYKAIQTSCWCRQTPNIPFQRAD